MQVLYENVETELGQRVLDAVERGLAVANAPRPLRGDEGRWEQWLPRQHGTHYAVGIPETHAKSWAEDDAWLVMPVTNEEIVNMLRHAHEEREARHAASAHPTPPFEYYIALYEEMGMDGIAYMAKQANLPYIPPAKPLDK